MKVMTRNLFSAAGINIDRVMIRYYNKLKEARANNVDPEQVEFLTNPEHKSMQMVMAGEVNRGGLVNRPEMFTRTELGRWFGMFFGYPLWLNTKMAEARARASNQERGFQTMAKGTWQIVKFMLTTAMIATPTAFLGSALVGWAYDEDREQLEWAGVQGIGDVTKKLTTDMAPFFPMAIGIYTALRERAVKPSPGFAKGGMLTTVPQSFYDSVMKCIRDSFATRSGKLPLLRFVTQWFPNHKVWLNRTTLNGSVEYYNVNKMLRGAAPSDLEYEAPTRGNIYYRATWSDNKDNVINALCHQSGTEDILMLRKKHHHPIPDLLSTILPGIDGELYPVQWSANPSFQRDLTRSLSNLDQTSFRFA